MQRIVTCFGQAVIGGNRKEHIGCLDRNLELVEILIFKDFGVVQRTFDHRLRAGFAVTFQQFLFERPGINPDTHRTAVVLGRLDDLAHAFCRSDITRVDPQARRTGFGGFDRTFVMEMDIGNDRDMHLLDDVFKRRSRFPIRAGNTNNIGTCFFKAQNLIHGCRNIGGQGVGHRLHRDRRISTNFHITNADLAAFAAFNISIRADAHFRFQANLCLWPTI